MAPKDQCAGERLTRRRFIKAGAGTAIVVGSVGLLPTIKLGAGFSASAQQVATKRVYVCPPCGQPCDKLTFDQPGQCPNCNMDLVPLGDSPETPPKVAILLFNGTELIDFAGPWEVFGTAGFLVHTVAETQEPLTMVFGQKVIADYTFENSPKADVLLVPGGGVFGAATINNPKMIQWIQAKAREVSHVMSVCTGAFLLQKAGLLAGHTVTTTYGMIEDLIAPETKVVYDQRFVESGNLITTAGLSSGIDGALHLVSKMTSKGKAQLAALSMEYPWDSNSQYARASMADRFLPGTLRGPKSRLKGFESTLISTEGNTDRWEIKRLVSEPHSSAEILEVVRVQAASNTAAMGMFKRIAHIRGPVTVSALNPKDQTVNWKFNDDEGHAWLGSGKSEPSADEKDKFILTLKMTRA